MSLFFLENVYSLQSGLKKRQISVRSASFIKLLKDLTRDARCLSPLIISLSLHRTALKSPHITFKSVSRTLTTCFNFSKKVFWKRTTRLERKKELSFSKFVKKDKKFEIVSNFLWKKSVCNCQKFPPLFSLYSSNCYIKHLDNLENYRYFKYQVSIQNSTTLTFRID